MNGGLGCDGDSVALTAATQPSIEEIVLGALPGLPKVAVHWPLIDFECGPEQGADTFIEWWHKADRGSSIRSCSWSRARSRTRRSSPRAVARHRQGAAEDPHAARVQRRVLTMAGDARSVGDRIERLLGEFRTGRDRETAEELVGLLVDMYGEALTRVAALLRERQPDLLTRLPDDDLLESLLLLHDLHPVDVGTRIQRAPWTGSAPTWARTRAASSTSAWTNAASRAYGWRAVATAAPPPP
jgi:hypothetical protein